MATEPTAEQQRATTLWVNRPPNAKPSEMIDYLAAAIKAAEDARDARWQRAVGMPLDVAEGLAQKEEQR